MFHTFDKDNNEKIDVNEFLGEYQYDDTELFVVIVNEV